VRRSSHIGGTTRYRYGLRIDGVVEQRLIDRPGKSCFLIYAPLRCLRIGGAVAVQNSSVYFLFTKETATIQELNYDGPFGLVKTGEPVIWCHSDSDSMVKQPCSAFQVDIHAFTIQAVSPHTNQWKY
jgi:hypothetical protein